MHLPRFATWLMSALVPAAERDEVLADLATEYGIRSATSPIGARLWLWRQVLGSLPAMLGRSWWRGWSGFEPQANRQRPGGAGMESWIMDLRYAARRLMSRPSYAILAV